MFNRAKYFSEIKHAIENKKIEEFKLIEEEDLFQLELYKENGLNLLQLAILDDETEVLKFNYKILSELRFKEDKDGHTLLEFAILHDRLEATKFLASQNGFSISDAIIFAQKRNRPVILAYLNQVMDSFVLDQLTPELKADAFFCKGEIGVKGLTLMLHYFAKKITKKNRKNT